VLGNFRKCVPEEPEKSFSLKEVMMHHFGKLDIPVFFGGQFGHVKNKWTFPIGQLAHMDADQGTVELL